MPALAAGLLFAAAVDRAAGQPGPADAAVTRQQRIAEEAARRALDRPLADAARRAAPAPPSAGGNGPWAVGLTLGALALLVAGVAWTLRRERPRRAPAAGSHIREAFSAHGPAARADALALSNPRFLDLAVAQRLLTPAERADLEARFPGNELAALLFLAEQRPAQKAILGKLWGDALEIAYVDPTKTIIQYELLNKLPAGLAEQDMVLPLYAVGEAVTVAMANPRNPVTISRLENALGTFVSPVFAFPDQLRSTLEIARVSARVLADLVPAGAATDAAADLNRLAQEESMAEFARTLFLLALKQRASDIHIEPGDAHVAIRMRIDGALQPLTQLPSALFPALSNVIKILAGADIGDRRRPQDGRITFRLPDHDLECRFSSIPTIYGEKMVLRLLGQNQFAAVPGLDDLQFAHSVLRGVRQIIESPSGVFFVTGPTGSGKTTTLYAALKSLDRKSLNIVTIEDPVEYRLAGVNQVQVNPQAGVTFASALRAFLRQDPDVILVGEIRDAETAKIAAQAALTGHLVLTTMHTNNALQAITRLIQIGVEPFLVAPSIIGVMAQRLVRRLCDHCKQAYTLTPAEVADLFDRWDGRTPVVFHRPQGCEHCDFIGYRGRVAIHELFVIDDAVRDHIARNATILDIRAYARSQGFTPMSYDGIKKVMRGLTSLEEIRQATGLND